MYFPTSVVISFHILHGELSPGPDGSSPALSSRGRFPDRLARAPLRGRAPRPDPGAVCLVPRRPALPFQPTLVPLIWKDLFSQHTLVFQGQTSLSSPTRTAWAAEDKSDKWARGECTRVLERCPRPQCFLGRSTNGYSTFTNHSLSNALLKMLKAFAMFS